jgi:phosphatidylserine/phosphatidylglycerophosphate/cardiolipin synthase-like enzyme
MLHGKLAVIDDVVALTVSTNVDSRSLFLNYELMFAFHDSDAIAARAAWFERERSSICRWTRGSWLMWPRGWCSGWGFSCRVG